MEGLQVVTIRQLLEKYGPEAKFCILDIQESIKLVGTLEKKMDKLIDTIQEKDLSISMGQYQEMSGDLKMSGEKKMLSEVAIRCNELPAVSTAEQRRYFRLEDIPTCSIGDDEVFYNGDGTEEEPIQID